MIKNLSHEILLILIEWNLQKKMKFDREGLFDVVKRKFQHEKQINLKKRMYDVINVFCSMGILSKTGRFFEININSPNFKNKESIIKSDFINKVSEVRKVKKGLNILQQDLDHLEKQKKFLEFLIKHNKSSSQFSLSETHRNKSIFKIKTPFLIVKKSHLEENPSQPSRNTIIRDYDLLSFKNN